MNTDNMSILVGVPCVLVLAPFFMLLLHVNCPCASTSRTCPYIYIYIVLACKLPALIFSHSMHAAGVSL